MKTPISRAAAAVALALPITAFASCGAAFCTINTNWTSQSALVDAGSSFDVHYEAINQDQPYSEGSKVAVGQIPHHHDEVSTDNHNLMATYSYGFGNGWGISVSAPIGERDHVHVHNHHGEQLTEEWKFTELGDTRVLGRYQFASDGDLLHPSKTGVVLGVKLPTGRFTVANDDGELAERSLQPGTGTTDLIMGAFYHRRDLAGDASSFAQVQYQHALNSRGQYRAGAQFSADVGYRKGVAERVGLLVQLNFLHKDRDSGSEAEPADSGGRYLFLSPGISYAIDDKLQVYGFYQQPLLRHVHGVQLTANHSFMAGISGHL